MQKLQQRVKQNPRQTALVVFFVMMAFISAVLITPYASSPQAYREIFNQLDDQKLVAMGMTSVVTVTSTTISMMPDDVGSAIAQELSDLVTPLMVIVCILTLEKFLLTTLGWAAFQIVILLACGLLAGYSIWFRKELLVWGKKMLVLGLAVAFLVPASVNMTIMIEETFQDSVSRIFTDANQLIEKTEEEENSNFLPPLLTV